MVEKIYLNWENVGFGWDNLNMTWEDVAILIEIGKKGGSSAYIKGNPWDVAKKQLGEEKAVKFMKLVCKINELDYEKVFESNSNMKITIGHIERVFNEGMKIGIKIL